MKFLASIVLPSNKGSNDIFRSISSIARSAEYKQCEFLVNLDGPACSLEGRIRDLKIDNLRIFNQQGSLSNVLNHLINQSNSEFIARADDDDYYFSNRLFSQILFMQSNPNVSVLGSAMILSKNNRNVGVKYYPEVDYDIRISSLFNCHTVAHPVAFIRRSVFEKFSYRDVYAEDFDLWVRLQIEGFKFANINVPLFTYSLPSYSVERQNLMNDSVVSSIQLLLEKSFSLEPDMSRTLSKLLCDVFTPSHIARADQEVLNYFISSYYPSKTELLRFMDCASKYNRRLYSLIESHCKLKI
jgi:hypothetical protein